MSFSKFIFSRTFLKHLVLAAVLFTVILILTMQGLKIYTRHGDANPVPDFTGMNYEEALETSNQYHLKIEIVDSVHVDGAEKGVVVDQVPQANFKVKKNRTVFLTVNSTIPEQVVVPRLTDISYRQALVLIENCGLLPGNIIYKPSEYNDLVLKVEVDSTEIVAGTQIAKGTSVDLTVGRSQGNLTTTLPNLTGLSVTEADEILTTAMLNQGVIIYDETILSAEDSVKARIWKQHPSSKITGFVNMGSAVDLWVTIDSLKIVDANDPGF